MTQKEGGRRGLQAQFSRMRASRPTFTICSRGFASTTVLRKKTNLGPDLARLLLFAFYFLTRNCNPFPTVTAENRAPVSPFSLFVPLLPPPSLPGKIAQNDAPETPEKRVSCLLHFRGKKPLSFKKNTRSGEKGSQSAAGGGKGERKRKKTLSWFLEILSPSLGSDR